jgi:hypothetical protein
LHTARILSTSAALGIILVSGLLHGMWTGRWGDSRELETGIERLQNIPLQIGDWKAKELEMDPKHLRQARLAGAWMRCYVQERTGVSLTVLLMCGRSGPVAAHPPNVCYGGAGYDMVGRPAKQSLASQASISADQFWTAKFKKQRGALPESLRIHWAWNGNGTWLAADFPRLSFGRFPVLYKLYVVRSLKAGEDRADIDPSSEFLRMFLLQIGPILFPSIGNEKS